MDYCHELTSLFSHWPDIISQVIQQTPVDTIHKIYVHDHNPTDVWHKNNLLMIGDAAHAPLPTSGQGACQALEDAWHLSNCLSSNTHNLRDVLTAFTQLRLAKTSQIITTGRHLASSIFSIDPEMIRYRNENSRKTDFARLAGAMSQGWSEHLPL